MRDYHDLERFLIVGVTPGGMREPVDEVLAMPEHRTAVNERLEHLNEVHPECDFEVRRVT